MVLRSIHVSSVAEAQRRLAAEAGAEGETLVLFAVTSDATYVDLPPTGSSPGDFVLSEQSLFADAALTRPAGSAAVRFEFSLSTVSTTVTARTGGGKIVVAGSQFSEQDATLAVTGGTGRYLGAGGLAIPFDLPSGVLLLLLRVIR